MSRNRFLRLLPVSLASLLLLAGCGGSTNPPAKTTGDNSTISTPTVELGEPPAVETTPARLTGPTGHTGPTGQTATGQTTGSATKTTGSAGRTTGTSAQTTGTTTGRPKGNSGSRTTTSGSGGEAQGSTGGERTTTTTTPPAEKPEESKARTDALACLQLKAHVKDFGRESELPLEAATVIEQQLAFKGAKQAALELRQAAAGMAAAIPASHPYVGALQKEIGGFLGTLHTNGAHGNPTLLAGPAEAVRRAAVRVEAFCR